MLARSELERRQREVLASLVRLHISSGLPVGSKAIAERLTEPLSAATIRNLMADLEEAGFLAQPHTSAGRIPTDKAYRFYVDHIAGRAPLGESTERYIDESLGSAEVSPDQLLARMSHVLAEVSENIGLVLGPPLEEKLLEHIRFILLPERRVLAVIVSKPDLVESRLIRIDEDVSQEELDRVSNYLSSEFRGWSLRAIRVEIFQRLEQMKATFDGLLASVGKLFAWGALEGGDTGTLFVEGTAKILSQPEFADARRVRELLAAFEEKVELARLLNTCLEGLGSGARIVIGRENPNAGMQQCAIVVAPFLYRDHALGAVGVVGPTRMHYDRAITAVEYVAGAASRLLSSN